MGKAAYPKILLPSGGFTLIELIVAISIIVVLTGGALTTFTGFRSTRIALGDAQVVVDQLNQAKRLAIAAEKPTECSAVTLEGYSVTFDVSDVSRQANCTGGSPPTITKSLPTGEITGAPSPVVFRVLSGATDDAQINICSQGHLFIISITSAGSVSEPLEVAGGC